MNFSLRPITAPCASINLCSDPNLLNISPAVSIISSYSGEASNSIPAEGVKLEICKDAAAAVSDKIHHLPKKHGLVPIFINPNTGHFLPHATITLGARGDSYYEYLLKQWLQTGKTINYLLDDFMTAIEGVREFLAKLSSPNKYLFIGELSSGSEAFNPKMDHLTCFLPGTLALGHANGLPDWHMTMAEELIHTCYLTYAVHPTFLAPEITHFNLGFEEFAKVPAGYTSLSNVKTRKPPPRDMMEAFFLSETQVSLSSIQ